MKRIILFLLVFSLKTSLCQVKSVLAPNPIIPLSPEAGNLGRYGEIAISEYTGMPDISIPLHTITSGKLSIPLNLYYNGSGIKVSQEATWVGLGWDLSAISAITYIAVGGNDQLTNGYVVPWSKWKRTIDYINPSKTNPIAGHEEFLSGWSAAGNDSGVYHPGPVSENTPDDVIFAGRVGRGEQDLFAVNGYGFSFKFYIDPAINQPVILGDKNNYKILINGSTLSQGFKIIDGDGITYNYRQLESLLPGSVINNWFITEIQHPDGDWIRFNYSNYGTLRPIPSLYEAFAGNCAAEFGGNQRILQGQGQIRNQYLTGIETKTEKVKFYLSNNRLDLAGDGARRLDSVNIESIFSKKTKRFAFKYAYFEASTVGGNYLDDDTFTRNYSASGLGITNDNLSKRLKLENVIERGLSELDDKVFRLAYNEERLLPLKTSFATDHWGNYNGEENSSSLLNFNGSSHTLIPKLFSVFLFNSTGKYKSGEQSVYEGANRGASSLHLNTSVLKSITYPTGGKTVFEFEPNTFNNRTVFSAQEEFRFKQSYQNYYIYDGTFISNANKAEFTLTEPTVVEFDGHLNNDSESPSPLTCEQMGVSGIELMAVPSFVRKEWKFNCMDYHAQNGKYNKVWKESLLLPASKYLINCGFPKDAGSRGYTLFVTGNFKFYSVKNQDSLIALHNISIGGGLRIKKIINYVGDNKISSTKSYSYNNENGSSSGKLLMPLGYVDDRSITIGEVAGEVCYKSTYSCLKRNSSSANYLSTSSIRATVGYGRVEIAELNEANVATNGTLVKRFSNDDTSSSIFFDDVILNDAASNGDLLSVLYLDRRGMKIQQDSLQYERTELNKNWVNLKLRDTFYGPEGASTANQTIRYQLCAYNGRYMLGPYPYTSYKDLLKKKTVTNYAPNGNIYQSAEYKYNNINYNVSELRRVDSRGKIFLTKYKYPNDFQSGGNEYDYLVNSHIINPLVEESSFVDSIKPVKRVKTNYVVTTTSGIKPYIVEQQIGNQPTENFLQYTRYVNGNIAELNQYGGSSKAIIWGYNFTLPIAEVLNAKYDNVFFTGFEDGAGDSNIEDSRAGYFSKINGYSKTLTGLSNGKYIQSYWYKTGDKWIRKEEVISVVNGSYTINLLGQIDDVSFYPNDAQMSTYSYEPLAGITSETDVKNKTTFYQFDNSQRLINIKNQDGNIIKNYKYHLVPN